MGYFQHFGAFIDAVSFYPLNCATNAQLDTLDPTKMHRDNEPQVTQSAERTVKQFHNPGDDAIVMPTNSTLSPMPPENTPLTSSAIIIADSAALTSTDHLAKCTCLAKSTEKINKNMRNSIISNSLASQIGDRTLWENDMVSLGSLFQKSLNENVKVSPGAPFDDMSIDNTLSQTSFGHISINSSSILTVSMATESP